MCAYNLFFGCRVKNQANAKLTRENYAEITNSSRKNSFKDYRACRGLSIEEANQEYFYYKKTIILADYNKKMAQYLDLIEQLKNPDKRDKILKDFINQRVKLRIEQEKDWNISFNIESLDEQERKFGRTYSRVLKNNRIDDKCDIEIRERFDKYQNDIEKIQNYDVNDMLWIQAPDICKKWYREDPKNHQLLNVPDDWIKEYIMEDAPYYTDKKCKRLQENALKNFDNNMRYFNSLNSEEFNNEINEFLKSHPTFEPVDDLRKYDGIAGVYIMVLDEYKQLYIGITRSKRGIKGRIQDHWSNTKPLDRLIWGSIEYSILSIDSFRAYDTTRIYVEPHPEFKEQALYENGEPKKREFLGEYCNVWGSDEYLFSKEFQLVKNAFSQKFLCNRCAGGGRLIIDAIGSVKGHDLCENSKAKLEETKNNLHQLSLEFYEKSPNYIKKEK